jgi:ATP-binding cassette subfamily B protein
MYEWGRSARDYFNLSSFVQGFGTLLYTGFSVLIVVNYVAQGGEANEILLLFYWTLTLPTIGQSFAFQVQQYPMMRNRLLRVLEPLAAPDEEITWLPAVESVEEGRAAAPAGRVGIRMEGVSIQAGGNIILREIDLEVQPGEHIAIVGPSGAGKSSLVGLLLGWHRPARGRILIDGKLLDGALLRSLRRETAWVDPEVQLWNRSLYDNLRYGSPDANGSTAMAAVIEEAELYGVLDLLPEGMKTLLGEGGGLLSGGEGQRVRLGRAFYRQGVRLAILDEPFRGLDRERRRLLLSRARAHWAGASLLFITHDVGETLSFERVLVIEGGSIAEDGHPAELAGTPGSRYKALLDAEDDVRRELWEGADWRRFVLEDGKLSGGES